MVATILNDVVVQATATFDGHLTTGTLSGITGTTVKIICIITSRGVISAQTHQCKHDGVSMSFVGLRDQNLNGFAKGRVLIFYRDIGTVVGDSSPVEVETVLHGAANADVVATFVGVDNIATGGSNGTQVQGLDSAASTALLTETSDFALTGLILGSDVQSPVTTSGDLTSLNVVSRNSATQQTHAVGYATGGGSHSCRWDWSSASFGYLVTGWDELAVFPDPDITSIVPSPVSVIDTAIAVTGVDFVTPNSNTDFYLADGSDFGTAVLVIQPRSGVTTTSLVWDSVDLGGVLSPGALFAFVVTRPGTGNERISSGFPITVNDVATPVIVDVDADATPTIDITDTNLTVNGTTLFTQGTTALWLAETNSFGAGSKVLQNISTIVATSFNWDDVDDDGGTVAPGTRFLFVVTNAGGPYEKTSAAFTITLTAPTIPVIVDVDGVTTLPSPLMYFDGPNQTINGTDFIPPGVTELWLGSTTDFQTTVKQSQVFSALTSTSMNWDIVNVGALPLGILYLFVVTDAGGVKERSSVAFLVIVVPEEQPVISAVNGGSTVLTIDTNCIVSGSYFRRPGVTEFYLADSTVFATATKVAQPFTNIDFFQFTWIAVVLGGLTPGTLFLFYRTDVGGPHEQTSGAFTILVTFSLIPLRIDRIGDGMGMVAVPVKDETPVEPDVNVRVLRDHACWTGLGVWFLGRDFVEWPTESSDIIMKGGLDGVWPGTQSMRVNSVAVSDADRVQADEELNIFTEAGRDTFNIGFWLNKTDLLTRGDVDNVSIFQIETAAPGFYLEVFAAPIGPDLHIGVAYDNGSRSEYLHSIKLEDTNPGGDWVFIQAEFNDSSPFMLLRQDGVEETSALGTGPQSGLYEDTFIVHDYVLLGGPNTPLIMLRMQSMFYGFGTMTLIESDTLRDSLTQTQYETLLKTIFDKVLSEGPIHYYRFDDKVPDRFLHNHTEDFVPGRIVGGLVQRNLAIPPSGVSKRMVSGAIMSCPTSDRANFSDWHATIKGQLRYNGGPNDTGVMLRLYNAASGAGIEIYKDTPGAGINESNGRVRFRAYGVGGSPLVEKYITNPSFDAFDGTLLAFGVTTSQIGNDWLYSIGDVGASFTQWLGVDAVPTWHGSPYDTFEIGSPNLPFDVHSVGYHSDDDQDIHTSLYYDWTTVADLIAYAQAHDYDGFYWCQNDIVND